MHYEKVIWLVWDVCLRLLFPVPFFVDMSVSDYICLEDSFILCKVSSVYIDLNMFFAVVIIFSSNFCLNTQATKKTQFKNVPADEL